MKLNVKQRMLIQAMMPEKGAYSDMMFREQIIDELKFSKEDVEYFGLKPHPENPDVIIWDLEKDSKKQKDCKLIAQHWEYLNKVILKLDEKEEISIDLFPIVKIIKTQINA